jgi:50S ribosomal protein L16 3-hydroxylase
MVARIRDELNKIRFTDDDITIFLGICRTQAQCFLRGAGPGIIVCSLFPGRQETWPALHRKTRMLYRGSHVFINGESFQVNRGDKILALADSRAGENRPRPGLEDLLEALQQWHESGWLEIVRDNQIYREHFSKSL